MSLWSKQLQAYTVLRSYVEGAKLQWEAAAREQAAEAQEETAQEETRCCRK